MFCKKFRIKVFTCDLECEYRKECDENIKDVKIIDKSERLFMK